MSRKPARRTATRRGSSPRKRAPARRASRRGLLDQAVAALPFSEATLQRIAAWGIVATVGAVLLGAAAWFGVPGMAGTAVAEAIGNIGFRVQEIQVTGLRRMDRMNVYAQALDQRSRAMPLVDLEKVRDRLRGFSWVEDARVSRRLPDTILIHIVEREPAAVWQNHGQLMLIDAKGAPLAPITRDAIPDLPRLIGEDANAREPDRRTLMLAAPALEPLVRAARWVGNRRWDLFFDTGETLQLPEGADAAAKALRKFAELDGSQRLLGRNYAGFDMRDPAKLVIRPRAVERVAPAAGGTPATNEPEDGADAPAPGIDA